MTSRPVWLTPHMGNRIYNLLVADGHVREADAFRLTWDAAPADAAEAIATWFNGHFPGALDNQDLAEFAADVLRALGCPNPEPHA